MMGWLDEELQEQNIDDYQRYLINKELKGRMTPSGEAVIRLIKKKGMMKDDEGAYKKTNNKLHRRRI